MVFFIKSLANLNDNFLEEGLPPILTPRDTQKTKPNF